MFAKSIAVFFLVGISTLASYAGNDREGFYAGPNASCYCDTQGNDWYWFCGKHNETNCKYSSGGNNYASGGNKVTWLYHGSSFNWTKRGGQGNYWCCNGTADKAGKFYQGENWLKTTRTATETIRDTAGKAIGQCTWVQKINICGEVDNPQDKCTEADPMLGCAEGYTSNGSKCVCNGEGYVSVGGRCECADGYVTHNKRCVKSCEEGYAFESTTSSKCVKVEDNSSMGVVGGVKVTCKSTEFFDNDTSSCKPKAERLQITTMAHEECWMCTNPTALAACMKLVSNGGRLSDNAALKAQCSLSSKRQ